MTRLVSTVPGTVARCQPAGRKPALEMTRPDCGTQAASCNSQPLEISVDLSGLADAVTAKSSAERVANLSPELRVLIKIIRANDDAPQRRWQEVVLQK